jgi:type VII secretion-associated serine protease mycosin
MLKSLSAVALALGILALPTVAPVGAHADVVRDQEQWVLDVMQVPQAWQTTRGSGVTVALVDSGVRADQVDLSGSVTTGTDFVAAFAPNPIQLHGTYMASLIAGHGHGPGGGAGMVGVAPQARLLSVRVIADKEQPGYQSFIHDDGYAEATAQGIRYATDHGADVINLSLGGPSVGFEEREAVTYALSKGVVVVAAAGNDGSTKKKEDKKGIVQFSYPGALPGVICVAAVDSSGAPASFSDRNAGVMVSAPGANVVGASPQSGEYLVGDGTSQATALVSGVAALIRSKYPHLMPALVAQAITSTTSDRPAAGYSDSLGFGEVDAAAALTEAGRLVHYTDSGAGKPAAGTFTDTKAHPIRVVLHPTGLIILGGWIGVASIFGLAGAVAAAVLLIWRIRAHDAHEGPWST